MKAVAIALPSSFFLLFLFLEELIVGSSDNLAQRCSLLLWQEVSVLKSFQWTNYLSFQFLPRLCTISVPSQTTSILWGCNGCLSCSSVPFGWLGDHMALKPKAECRHRGPCVDSSLSAAASSPTPASQLRCQTCPRVTSSWAQWSRVL